MTKPALVFLTAALAASSAQAGEKRAADAHQHGHGSFILAIDHDAVVMALESPAHDIVGFEHAPSTPEQRAAITAAAARLARPDQLFALPAEAGCVAGRIEIAFGALGSDDHDEHGHDEHGHEKHDDHGHDDHEDDDRSHGKEASDATHSEVKASYRLACADTDALKAIDFGFFDSFPNARELSVVVLSETGQFSGEANAAKRVFEIE